MKLARQIIAPALLLASSYASAGLIVGDFVTITFNPVGGSVSGTVGAGDDITIGNFQFELNGGGQGDVFDFRSTPSGGFFGGSSSFTVSSLLFAGGALITGFNLFEENLANFSFSTTATSITFNYTDTFAPVGQVIRGQFITTAVPEPGSVALLGLALTAFGLSRRKKK